MLNTQTHQSTVFSWSSYFTKAAKALALLGGVGGIGIGILRYLRTEDDQTALIVPELEVTQRLEADTQTIFSLPAPQQFEISIPENPQTQHVDSTSRYLRSAPSVLNPIPDQVININEAYDSTIDVKQVFGENMEVLAIVGNFPSWMSSNYYPKLASYAMPGNAYTIKVVGPTAYVADGTSGLYILNIANSANPSLLGRYDTPGIAYDVEVFGNTAYVADGNSLQILDVSNPASVTMLGSFVASQANIKDIALMGNIACVLNNAFLYLFNVTNVHPSSIGVPISGRTLPTGNGNQVVTTQTTAYVAATTGVYVFSFSPIGGVFYLGAYNTFGGLYDISVIGTTAYVTAFNTGLQILDIKNPTAPSLLGTYNSGAFAYKIAVKGTIAYMLHTSGLQIINVTNSAAPSLLSIYSISGGGNDVTVVGTRVYVVRSDGLKIINVTNPASPTLLGSCNMLSDAYDIAILGNMAYVAGGYSGLQIINITNSTAPIFLGAYNTPGSAVGVSIVGTAAYVADDTAGLQIINITNPNMPSLLGVYDTPGNAFGVTVIGTTAYVADFYKGLQIINVTNSAMPTLLYNYNALVRANSVIVVNSIAYVLDMDLGLQLQIINVANPTNLESPGYYPTTNAVSQIALFNHTVMLALSGAGFELLSITNPTNLTRLSNIVILNSIFSMTQVGMMAFMAEGATGLQIFNLANTSQPLPMGTYNTPGFAMSMTVMNGIGYIADGLSGLQIINLAQARLQGTPTSSNMGERYLFTAIGTERVGNFAIDTFDITVTQFPTIFQPITPPQAYWEQKLFHIFVPNITFNNPTNTNPLSYSATLSDNSPLPNWIHFNATGLAFFGTTPHVDMSTSWIIRLKATNTMGGYASTTFPIIVDPNSPPVIIGSVPVQYAKVNQPYNYFIPQGMFVDPDGDPLLFNAHFFNSTTLPNWLSFNPISATFAGTPHGNDVGNFTVIVSATDNIAGSISTQFRLYVSYLPLLVGRIPAQVAGIDVPYQYIINKNIFNSPSDSTFVYDLRRSNGLLLPQWLHFNTSNLVLSGTANRTDIGTTILQITARDIYQSVVNAIFDLTVENLPQVQKIIPNQIAGVNQAFVFTLPIDIFNDVDGELLTYQAKTETSAILPNWLQWNGNTQTLTGTPQLSDIGVMTIQMIATDPVGGSAVTSFQLSVTQFPLLNHPITPPNALREGKPFSFTIPADTFSDPNHLLLTYTTKLIGDDSLPTWLSFYSSNLTFVGTPMLVGESTLVLQVTATNSQGGFVTAPLTFHIVPNSAPIVANPISNLVAQVGISFKFVIPDTTFSDPDGDDLTYSAQLSDGSTLPAWLQFTANIFSGAPSGDDTNFYQARILPISLKASDGSLSGVTAFNIRVEGVSTGEQVVKIVSPILSVLGTSYGLYRKRALLFNHCCKKRYQRLEDTAVVGEPYRRQLETPAVAVSIVQAKFQRSKFETCVRFFRCQTNAMPGGTLLPNWLEYDEATNTLHSKGSGPKEANVGVLIIQVKNTDGVVQEQFTIKVRQAEHVLDEAETLGFDETNHHDDIPLQNVEHALERQHETQESIEIIQDVESPRAVTGLS